MAAEARVKWCHDVDDIQVGAGHDGLPVVGRLRNVEPRRELPGALRLDVAHDSDMGAPVPLPSGDVGAPGPVTRPQDADAQGTLAHVSSVDGLSGPMLASDPESRPGREWAHGPATELRSSELPSG